MRDDASMPQGSGAGRLAVAVVVCGVVAGTLLGGTLALWRDTATFSARMPAGVAVFGVGAPGPNGTLSQYATADGQSLTFAFGPAQATALYNGGAGAIVAVPVQVDSLSQGHRGLRYTVTTELRGGVFGASQVQLYRVDSPAACTTSTTATVATTSTPWTADHTATTALLSEYWCLVARYVPVTGTHTNTATATGTPVVPNVASPPGVTATDTWTSTVQSVLDPAAEPTHTLTFAFTTFRPGGAP